MKKVFAILMAAVLAIAAFAGCDSEPSDKEKSANGNDSRKEAIELFIKLSTGTELSVSQMKKLQPKAFYDWMEKNEGGAEEYYNKAKEEAADMKKKFEDAFAKDYKVSVKINSEKKLSESERNDATSHLHSVDWYDMDKEQEVYAVDFDIVVTYNNKTETFAVDGEVLKYDGSWYMLSADCDELDDRLG